jgi:hypothetical protein
VQRAGAEAIAAAPSVPSAAVASPRAGNGAGPAPHAISIKSDARNAPVSETGPGSARAPLTAGNDPLTAAAYDPFAASDALAIVSHPPHADDAAPAADAIRVSQAARVPDGAQHDAGTAIAISVIEPAFDDLVAAPRPYVVPAYQTTTIAPSQPPPTDASRTATARHDGSAPERKIRIVIDRIEIAAPPPPPPRPKPRQDTSMSLEAFLGRRR